MMDSNGKTSTTNIVNVILVVFVRKSCDCHPRIETKKQTLRIGYNGLSKGCMGCSKGMSSD